MFRLLTASVNFVDNCTVWLKLFLFVVAWWRWSLEIRRCFAHGGAVEAWV